jgi:pilus assembly protein Flp/PilA
MTSIFKQARFMGQWLVARLNITSEAGATAVEYGLMVALIAAVIIISVAALGTQTDATFDCVATSVETRGNACP